MIKNRENDETLDIVQPATKRLNKTYLQASNTTFFINKD
jgi:hypothetical protein